MKHHTISGVAGFILALNGFSMSAWAYDQPPVNLGFTSFLDGAPPAGPGLYAAQYLQYYRTTQFNDANGDALPLPDPELDVFISLTQLIYQSDKKFLLGGKWGLDVILPVVGFNLDYGAAGPFPESNDAGVGDLLIGPYLQWDPIMGSKGPRFMHRIELQCNVPTGRYAADRELNPGSGFFSFNPYWAGTYFLTPRWTASLRFHYLWNDENDEPNRGFAGATRTQAGQAVHANFATEYELLTKRLRAGINGYFLKQITATTADGQDVPDREEQVIGIGPGLVYHFSQHSHLFLNTYFETAVQNRTEGMRFNFRFVHHF